MCGAECVVVHLQHDGVVCNTGSLTEVVVVLVEPRLSVALEVVGRGEG